MRSGGPVTADMLPELDAQISAFPGRDQPVSAPRVLDRSACSYLGVALADITLFDSREAVGA